MVSTDFSYSTFSTKPAINNNETGGTSQGLLHKLFMLQNKHTFADKMRVTTNLWFPSCVDDFVFCQQQHSEMTTPHLHSQNSVLRDTPKRMQQFSCETKHKFMPQASKNYQINKWQIVV